MKINTNNYLPFVQGRKPIFFSKKDLAKIQRMEGSVDIISTVCPDYPNDGKIFTFTGVLGGGVSLTALQHFEFVPCFLEHLKKLGLKTNWKIVVADLPELVESQKEFYERVAKSKEGYIQKCAESVKNIQALVGDLAQVYSFGSFHSNVDYIQFQSRVSDRILDQVEKDYKFQGKFNSFMYSRRELAQLFRGKHLSNDELKIAAAHGMSLYISHGTLIREKYRKRNVIVINHLTPNLQNFFLARFVEGYEQLENSLKFPLGIIEGKMY